MATVDMRHVQFWQPPNSSFCTQRPASHKHGRSASITTNSQNQPVHQKADSTLKCGRDLTGVDNKADEYFPSVEELLRKEILRAECQNSEDALQRLDEPSPETSGSCPDPAQLRLDHGVSNNQGTRDSPVILEDDKLNTPFVKAAAVPFSTSSRIVDICCGNQCIKCMCVIPS